MIAMNAAELLRTSYALPAAGVLVALLIYLLFVSSCLVGRLQLLRRPADAALITDDGPAIGERVPEAVMDQLARQLIPTMGWGNGRRLAVVFAAPGCAPCRDLLPDLGPAARRWRADTRLMVVLETGGMDAAHPALAAWRDAGVPLVSDESGALTRSLGIEHRPLGLLLDPAGVVLMKGIVSSGGHLDALVQEWGVSVGRRTWKPAVSS
jgi:hypothetical protein